MPQRHVIELALDLARMRVLARSSVELPIPANVIELMRIAAASPKACQDAAEASGESMQAVIDAARFFLQQSLFRSDADSFRILGIKQGASRATARSHMRWLMQWLHPDRNGDMEALYAERVLKAWREISARSEFSAPEQVRSASKKRGNASAFRLPWIKQPHKGRPHNFWWAFASWVLPSGLVIVVLALLAVYYFGAEQTIAAIRIR